MQAEPGNNLDASLSRAPVGFAEVAEDGTIVIGNRLAHVLLGESELAGCKLADFIHPDSIDGWELLWRRFLTSEPSTTDTLQVRLTGGRTKYLRFTLDREHQRGLLWLDDRSEHQALSAQLLSQAAPDRQFVHDLNDCLATTTGYVDLVDSMLDGRVWLGGETLEALRAWLSEIRLGLDRTDALINSNRRPPPAKPAATVAQRPHILVVDDEPAILEYLQEFLGDRYEVSAFASGAHALQFYRANPLRIDLALVDHLMPDIGGIGLATELSAEREDLPVILCSADPATIAAQSDGSLRIRHFLKKPIDIRNLRKMVTELLPGA